MVTRVIVVALVVASLGASAFAVGFMGPPTAELKAGQWNIGYSFSYSRQDLDKSTAKGGWSLVLEPEEYEDSGTYTPWKVKPVDATAQRHYAVFGYGLSDQWEVYGQVGIADVKSDVKEYGYSTYGINFDNDLAYGVGTRVTLVPQNPDGVAWGLSAQLNWLDTSIDDKGTEDPWSDADYDYSGGPYKEETNLDAMELLVAFGPTIDMTGWKLYGGPYWYYLSGDLDYKFTETGTWDDGVDTGPYVYREKESGDYDASTFGGFIGAIFNIADNCKATIEGQMHTDGWGAGSSIMFTF